MKILVCDNLEKKVVEKLSDLGEVTNISDSKNKTEELMSNIVDTDIVVIRSSTKINKDILQEANKLKIIARCGVGIDNIDIEEATNKEIYVTNSPNANIISVAELTIGLIISAARNIHTSNNSLILYTIVETKLAKYISNQSERNNVPCFGILGNLILSFSKLLNQKAIHKPSAQHVLDEDYYKRIEAIQFTMAHDDGKKVDDIKSADVILLGVSRTSKTPTSIYLANRGYKTINIPLVLDQQIPKDLITNKKICIIGLVADPERLADIRRNRVAIMKDHKLQEYTDLSFIKKELDDSKNLFKKNNWPIIDVTRKSVEETAASILKIIEIKKNK